MTPREALDELAFKIVPDECKGCKCGESDCTECKNAILINTLEPLVEKSEKYAWHSLEKNPSDLPEKYEQIEFLTYRMKLALGDYEIDNKFYDDSQSAWWIDKDDVLAWRYIEPFEEEEE